MAAVRLKLEGFKNMGRNLDPKCKQCRRVGEKLFLKGARCFSPKCAMVKRNYPPGMHGPKGQSRLSGYGQQLREKQKAMKTYRLNEKQFNNYYKKAKKIKGNTAENLLILLETRLDNVVYRLGFAVSRDKARQIVSHGNLLLNNRSVDIPSIQAKTSDLITVKPHKITNSYYQEVIKKLNKKSIPSWLTIINDNKLEAKIVKIPAPFEINSGLDFPIIIEYYSQ